MSEPVNNTVESYLKKHKSLQQIVNLYPIPQEDKDIKIRSPRYVMAKRLINLVGVVLIFIAAQGSEKIGLSKDIRDLSYIGGAIILDSIDSNNKITMNFQYDVDLMDLDE